jgi:hypothetical protein
VIVSTRPEEPPVIRIRKLERKVSFRLHGESETGNSILSRPTLAVFLFPYTLEFLDELHSKLLLAEIATCFDNHR